jgi:phage terminase small subunit
MAEKSDTQNSALRAQRHLALVNTSGEERHNNTGANAPKSNRANKGPADPITGLTPKQQTFVDAYIGGSNASDAYREAYDTSTMRPSSVHREAYALLGNPKITACIVSNSDRIQTSQRMMHASRSERYISKLEELAAKADSHANQIRAIELLGKSIGLWVERVETSDKTERTSDEIRASLADKLKRLSI